MQIQHKYKIYQGQDGRWRTNVIVDGKRKMIVRTTREKLDAFLDAFYKPDEDITMRELYPEWIEYKALHVSAPTITRLGKSWKSYYINEDIINKPIRAITKLDLDIWIHEMIQTRKMTRKQYNNYIAVINGLFDYAVDRKIIERNVKRDVRLARGIFSQPRKKDDSEQVFTAEELSKLIELALQDFENVTHPIHELVPLAVVFMFYTGLRIGEITALQYKDIQNDTLTVQRMYRIETREIIEKTKGGYGTRSVPLSAEALDLITLCRQRQAQRSVKTKYIFSMSKDPAPYLEIQKAFYRYCERIGTSKKSSHKARKTYVSTLLEAGVNISSVQKAVGHLSKQTTYDSYVYDRGTSSETAEKIKKAVHEMPCKTAPKSSKN